MRFLDKIQNEAGGSLKFLKDFGFTPNETCGYGCCKGWFNSYSSFDGLYFNRVTVWMEGDDVKSSLHQEYNCGGLTMERDNSIWNWNGDKREVLLMIDELLPSDLD